MLIKPIRERKQTRFLENTKRTYASFYYNPLYQIMGLYLNFKFS